MVNLQATAASSSTTTAVGMMMLGLLGMAAVAAVYIATRPMTASGAPPAAGLWVYHASGVQPHFVPIRAHPAVLRIGRAPGSQLTLNDEQVSAAHADVRWTSQGPAIYDLNSRNGVYVNGQRLSAALLRHGDEIRIGGTRMVVHVAARASAGRASTLHRR